MGRDRSEATAADRCHTHALRLDPAPRLRIVDRRDEVVLAVGSAAEIEQCIHDWLERLSRATVTAR